MNPSTSWPLQSASVLGRSVDMLFLALVGLTTIVALAVAVLVVYFAVHYRHTANVDRRNPPTRARWIEITWTAIPLAIFIGLFVWSSILFAEFYRPPGNAMRVHVLAKQWMWKLEHENGRREIDELHVPLGQPVELIMTSQDVIHSFFIPAFRAKQDVLPGRYTSLWFTANRAGRFNLFCAEYCGTDHANMHGSVVVLRPNDFARWLAAKPAAVDLISRGFEIYRSAGCSGCHEPGSTVHAPGLPGLARRLVHLSDGRQRLADANYLRDSILVPDKDIVAGFAPIMPSYQGQLDESDLSALIAYIESLRDGP
jgi:cytochrome c oxidase subunit 2